MTEATKQAPAPRFPALTEERAEEIADIMLMIDGGSEDLLILAAELVLGLAPVSNQTENLDRADLAEVFIRRAFYHTRAFGECCEAFKQRLGDPETRLRLRVPSAAAEGETTDD